MKHYEQRFQADLDALVATVDQIGGLVQTAMHEAVRAVSTGDEARAATVILNDNPINRLVRSNDAACHAFVARHFPAAGPLRLISSILRIHVALERIGDYAVTLCRVAAQRRAPLSGTVGAAVHGLAAGALDMLADARSAFHTREPDLARRTIAAASAVDRLHDTAFRDVIELEGKATVREIVNMLTILASLERVSDQAKNVAEECLFAFQGEVKAPKVWRVLFVDREDALAAQLARAVCSKAWPVGGRFYSAGSEPAAALDEDLVRAAERLGLDLGGAMPRPLLPPEASGTDHHLVVVLDPTLDVPVSFHTVRLRWDVAEIPPSGAPGREAAIEDLARDVAARMRGLMEVLRGPDAA